MTRSLPPSLCAGLLPFPELCALVLDGALWRRDAVFHPIDEPDRAGLRADAVIRSFYSELGERAGGDRHRRLGRLTADERHRRPSDGHLVIAGLSAAWVHGALSSPPAFHRLLARAPRRVPSALPATGWSLSQARIADGDICTVGGWPVLAPVPTALSLARELARARQPVSDGDKPQADERDSDHVAVLRRLLAAAGDARLDDDVDRIHPRRREDDRAFALLRHLAGGYLLTAQHESSTTPDGTSLQQTAHPVPGGHAAPPPPSGDASVGVDPYRATRCAAVGQPALTR